MLPTNTSSQNPSNQQDDLSQALPASLTRTFHVHECSPSIMYYSLPYLGDRVYLCLLLESFDFSRLHSPPTPRDPPISNSSHFLVLVYRQAFLHLAILHGFWEPKLRTSCFYRKHFTSWAISQPLHPG